MTAPVVDVPGLRAALASATPPVVLDVRWSLTGPPGNVAFAAGHVPGAVYVDLDEHLADPPGDRGRHPLPDPGRFAAAMRRAGVALDRPVVVMDGADGAVAARAWWLLRHHGHDDVRVLDGGFAAWLESGSDTATGGPVLPHDDAGPSTGRPFTADVARSPVLDAQAAAALARTGVLLDARAPARYAGEVEPVDRVAGHIPGAVNAPTSVALDAHGRFVGPDVLRARFADLEVRPGVAVGAYCGSGVTAAHTVLVLHSIGIEAALYPGSWSEWIADSTRPVATTAKRG
ncbi:MAG: sulfurtransferase [Actinomycetales bacterium]|nr:sulfurtransferase [Actinomycetales bacterium]